jgi:hypothetical protein
MAPAADVPVVPFDRARMDQSQWQGQRLFVHDHHAPRSPAARDRVPYNVAQVQLDEDPQLILITNLVGIRNEDIRIGMPVRVVFEEHSPGVMLPKFERA